MLTAGFLGSGLSLLGTGVAVDRLGSRIAMIGGTLSAAVALAVAAVAAEGGLCIALAVFGVGSSVVPIAGVGALFRAYPVDTARLGARRAADGRAARRDARRGARPGAQAVGGVT